MWKIYQCGYLADRANSWRICAQQQKLQKAPVGIVPGGAAVTQPAKAVSERRQAGPCRSVLLCRSAAVGVAVGVAVPLPVSG